MTSVRQRFIEDMQLRNFSLVKRASYTREVSEFARHFNKSPELLGPEQVRAQQVYPRNQKKLGVVSISTATCALRFLYKVTIKKNWCMADIIPAPKVPNKLLALSNTKMRFASSSTRKSRCRTSASGEALIE